MFSYTVICCRSQVWALSYISNLKPFTRLLCDKIRNNTLMKSTDKCFVAELFIVGLFICTVGIGFGCGLRFDSNPSSKKNPT